MTDVVVDTNVWALLDRFDTTTKACSGRCFAWHQQFQASTDRLVLDFSYQIYNEYKANIPEGGLAEQYLRTLFSEPYQRIHFVHILDNEKRLILPEGLQLHDESDAKFVAAALQCQPPAPIINATDTDWVQEAAYLEAHGIGVNELCPDYIAARQK